jgi:hypothetical protein
MAKQWAVAPFQIGDKLPDDHLSQKEGEDRQDHYARCRATILFNDKPFDEQGVEW